MKPVLNACIITLATLLLLTGCRENEQIRIGGSISAYPDEAAVDGTEVNLSAQLIEQGSFNSTFQNLDTKYTGDDGTFEFTIDPIRANRFKLDISGEPYRTKSIEFFLGEGDNEMYLSETLVLFATLEVHIKNTNPPVSASDLLKIRLQDIPDVCDNCSSNEFIYLAGAGVDTVLTYQVAGNDQITLEYSVDKEDDSFHTISKYCHPGDTNSVQITY